MRPADVTGALRSSYFDVRGCSSPGFGHEPVAVRDGLIEIFRALVGLVDDRSVRSELEHRIAGAHARFDAAWVAS